jgi:hypothetical protein
MPIKNKMEADFASISVLLVAIRRFFDSALRQY